MGEAARRHGYRLVRILADMVRSALRWETYQPGRNPSAPSISSEAIARGGRSTAETGEYDNREIPL